MENGQFAERFQSCGIWNSGSGRSKDSKYIFGWRKDAGIGTLEFVVRGLSLHSPACTPISPAATLGAEMKVPSAETFC